MRGKGFFGQTRRERRAYPAVDLEGASNEVWPKKNCRPEGCAEFGLWLRCSSVTAPLWGMRPPRASPQAKLGATNVTVFMFMTTCYDWTSRGVASPWLLPGRPHRDDLLGLDARR